MEESSAPIPPAPTRPAPAGRIAAGAAVAFAALFVVGIVPKMQRQSRLDTALAAEKAPLDVTVARPTIATDDPAASLLPGTIQAVSQTAVGARTTGYVRRLFVDIGAPVKAGQALAQIESPEIDQQLVQAQADAARSEAGVRQSEAEVAQVQAGVTQQEAEVSRLIANRGAARAQAVRSKSAYAQAKAAASGAEAKVAQTRQMLAQRQADLKQIQSDLDIAEKTHTRWAQLVKEGAVAQQVADEKEATRNSIAAKVDAAKAAVEAATADVRAAEDARSASRSQVAAAAADVESAGEGVAAAEAAIRSGQATVLAAHARVTAGQSNLHAARAAVGSSQANVRRYAVLRGFETVVAPFDGVVTSRNVDIGTLVSSGTATSTADLSGSPAPRTGLFGVARTDVLRVQVSVPQALLSTIKTGDKATVLIRELPGRKFVGTVHQKAGALDSGTRTLLTEVWLPNPGGRLLPGMYAQVQFGTGQTPAQPLPHIPSAALIADAQGTRVATVTAGGKIHFVPVEVSRDFGAELEITRGIAGKETLILNPSDDLQEGQVVHPVEVEAKP